MIDVEHANAYREVLEILKHISLEDYNKIPKEKIEVFEKFSNKNWKFNYNPNMTLQENNASKITKTIIAILFRDYWATPVQREKIIKKETYDREKKEELKRKIYNPENLFKNRSVEENISKSESLLMIEYKENFFTKLINKIKSLFCIKRNS